jgi:hypothetical protein
MADLLLAYCWLCRMGIYRGVLLAAPVFMISRLDFLLFKIVLTPWRLLFWRSWGL